MLLFVLNLPAVALAAISVRDDQGNAITLKQPARRVVTLAPHATELVFAAGGGDRIVGTVDYSDFPPAARDIPRVGDHQMLDIERILALKPDLLIVWLHGNSERQIASLRRLGIPFFFSEPHKLNDIPQSVRRLGKLLGTEDKAEHIAAQQEQRLADLTARYGKRPKVRVFYQVWGRPLYTLNGQHIVSDALRLCGGENVFADLAATAPMVSLEAVLQRNPEVILTGGKGSNAETGLDIWTAFPSLHAVKRGNLFAVDADLLNRSGPRLIEGTAAICDWLERARSRR